MLAHYSGLVNPVADWLALRLHGRTASMRLEVLVTQPGRSALSGDEAWAARIDNGIEPLPGLNVIDFVKRIVRQGRDVEVFLGSRSRLGGGEDRCAALHGPCQQYLRGCLL